MRKIFTRQKSRYWRQKHDSYAPPQAELAKWTEREFQTGQTVCTEAIHYWADAAVLRLCPQRTKSVRRIPGRQIRIGSYRRISAAGAGQGSADYRGPDPGQAASVAFTEIGWRSFERETSTSRF